MVVPSSNIILLKTPFELDYKNKMILAYNVELNKSILNAINVVIDEARDNINRRFPKTIQWRKKRWQTNW